MTDPRITAWARAAAAAFPPLTSVEIAIVGRLAAKLDARIAERQAGKPAPPTPPPPPPKRPPGPKTPPPPPGPKTTPVLAAA